MEEKKYEMIINEEKLIIGEHVLRRIKALRDFDDVKKGDIGGYIEKESNLSHNGLSWIYDSAMVFDCAIVFSDAQIFNQAKVYDEAEISGHVKVCNNAEVYGKAKIYGHAQIRSNAKIYDEAEVYDYAEVYNHAKVYDYAEVYGNAEVGGYAEVFGDTEVFGSAIVYGTATKIHGDTRIYGNSKIDDKVCDSGAEIQSNHDYITFGSVGSEDGNLTVFKTKNNGISCTRGCFKGTLEEFEKAVKEKHDDNEYAKEYALIIGVIKNRFNK